LLGYARRLLELNDEAVARVRGTTLEGWVRLGMQEDFGESVLPGVLARFARSHPKVRVEARVARNRDLLERVAAGRLDLARVWGDPPAGMASQRVARLRMHWIGAGPAVAAPRDSPLPLVAFEGPCCFRAAATDALDRAGTPWRLAFTSASLSGLLAAAAAGLGVTVRTRVGLRSGVRPLGKSAGLPRLPSVSLHLVRAADSQSAPAAQLRAIIVEAVRPAP
jgi:DNA-binding transcriptional LysR family regulator